MQINHKKWFFSNQVNFMKRTEMVKKSKDFQSIINYKHFYKNKYFAIYASKPDNTFLKPKFGIAVGKALGDAVNRNLMKRRVRNIIDNNKNWK